MSNVSPDDIAWHQLQAEETVQLLEVNLRTGLSNEEVGRRRERHGRNVLTAQKRRSELVRFLLQFHAPLLYILLASTAITLVLGEWVDASVIFGVVLINAIVGYLQESKAEKSIEALSRMVKTETTVRRDGRKSRIPSEDLVPGDVVLLQSGDRVPADLRLFHTRNLRVDEASLTGESVPVEKHTDALALNTVLAERGNLAFAGTLVTYGQAEGVVWATGDRTEMGRVATLVLKATTLETPLTRKIAQFSQILLVAILILAAATFAVGVLRGESWNEMFMAAVAMAVGAIPEGLPAAVTITLAIGVGRMARRRAIIRKLPAVETLGSTTVICSDKTGTLTENQMTVQRVVAGGECFAVTGGGYEPHGEIRMNDQPVTASDRPALLECLKAGLLCNDSQVVRREGRLTVEGDPTEASLIVAAQKAGLLPQQVIDDHPRLAAIPFESEHQYMATLNGSASTAETTIYVKGAIERVLEHCSGSVRPDGSAGELNKADVLRLADDMAADGLRVLALARRKMPPEQRDLTPGDLKNGLLLLGLQGMIDPPRAEAIHAVHKCQTAGIEVKMITGDHILTAQAIARQIGLKSPAGSDAEPVAIEGKDLNEIPDEQLPDRAEQTAVFARVVPEQKLRLVKALQSRGHVVAMTGDGVNDAPALKQADIGVAMAITGTDVAKGAADMLLTDDNFASIEAAVEEGRNVFDNLTKFIVWTLPTNFGEGLVILAAIFAGTALPVRPVQVLYINMISALLLGLMLVFEPKERNLMDRPPRNPKAPIMTVHLMVRVALVSFLMLAGAFWIFNWHLQRGGVLEEAQTAAVNVIVFVEIFYVFNCRSLTRSVLSVGLFSNWWLLGGVAAQIAAQIVITYMPLANRLFHTAPITLDIWWRVLAVSAAASVVVAIEKTIAAGVTSRPRETSRP